MFRATYRLQLRDGMDFRQARGLAPYFEQLGVSHLYLSPIARARQGSSHGYDVVDPSMIDPALGTEQDFIALVTELRSRGLGVVLDIVPNHLATGSENRYWEDVLAWGRQSAYAEWFDIHWERGKRVFLPVLGDWMPRVLERGELSLVFRHGRFRVAYFDETFPIAPSSVPALLEATLHRLELRGVQSDGASGLRTIRDRIAGMIGQRADPRGVDGALDALGALAAEDGGIAVALRETCARYGQGGTGPMPDLLATQPYRLAYWRRAAREINYRRFFTVSHLVAVRQERDDVFAATHRLVLHLVEQGLVDGVRVDHVDGLLHPSAYLERLQTALAAAAGEAREVAVWVEKILAPGEDLPEAWPVLGTTGYEFLASTDALSIDFEGWERIEWGYRALVRPRRTDFPSTAHRAKRTILTEHVAADVTRLAKRALRLASPVDEPLSVGQVGAALVAIVAALDRYRVYVLDTAPWYDHGGREALESAVQAVKQESRVAPSALRLLAWLLLLDPEPIRSTPEVEHRVDFARRVGQLSVTAAAKGVEDTALYRYVPLVALNEVGCEPTAKGLSRAVDRFHAANTKRRHSWPYGLLSTSTHDTKRSADARARLAVLSEIPDEWLARVRRWRRLNMPHRSSHGSHRRPDANIEYLFYQTAVGIWPPPAPAGDVGGRLEAYMLKAAREAKIHTSWARPDEAYEDALRRFVRGALDPTGPFVEDLTAFVRWIAGAGLWNAVGRTLVHVTVPGVPDIYQGDERWAFLLVDPDNRVAVDIPHHAAMLSELKRRFDAGGAERRALLDEIVTSAEDGRVKLHVISRALAFRRQHQDLLADGAYVSLRSVGGAEPHVVAFARHLEDAWSITVVPRLPFTLTGQRSMPATGDNVWQDTSLRLPEGAAGRTWRSVLTGDIVEERGSDGPMLRVADALGTLPVALLASTR